MMLLALMFVGLLQEGFMDAGKEELRVDFQIGESAGDLAPSLARIRALYLAAVDEEDAIDRGLREVAWARSHLEGHDPLGLRATLSAYDGALVTLRAKHALWPTAKMRHLRQGLEVLDASVDARPDAAEIRYLRLMSCYYLPAVLGRRASVRDDFAALASLLPRERGAYPAELYRAIAKFVLTSGELTREQRAPLEVVLQAEDA